jgi:hypothetical protein
MAAKKKNNGINLLRGISGDRLAKLIAILFVLVAIPATVLMSQSQQNIQQDAAGFAPVVYQPYEITSSRPCTSGRNNWYSAKVMGTWTCLTKCYEMGGQCYDTAGGKTVPTYKGKALSAKPGYCPGASSVTCYKPSGPEKCKSDYPKGNCQATYKSCTGGYKTDLCAGFDWYRCCTRP